MSLREANIDKLDGAVFDVLVVGGGINGAVSAASLSARGVKVALIDATAHPPTFINSQCESLRALMMPFFGR